MKKFLAALAVFLACVSPVQAQTKDKDNVQRKPVMCYPAKELLTFLQEKHKEQPVFILSHNYSDETLIALMVNPDTGTYTLFEFNAETACVLASGQNFKMVPVPPPGSKSV